MLESKLVLSLTQIKPNPDKQVKAVDHTTSLKTINSALLSLRLQQHLVWVVRAVGGQGV